MKKLIVLASAIVVACTMQAASFTWGFFSDSIIAPGGGAEDYLEGGTAFLYLGTVSATESAFNFGTAQLLATAGQDARNYNFGIFDGMNNPASSDLFTSTAAGQAYTLILVDQTVTSLDKYEGDFILVNGTSTEGTDPMSGVKWGVMVNATAYQGSDWSKMAAQSGDVPEPTSGLLLLLGVASLALKRKRA